MTAAWFAALVGLAQGIRHAFEPDHLAAVSTLASGRRGGFWLGASWGLGHTVALVLVGGTLTLLEAPLSARASAAAECLVALMLVVLGVRALVQAKREGEAQRHRHAHHSGILLHAHHTHDHHVHAGHVTLAARPLLIGVVHGLAGSGAISALVIAELPDAFSRLRYIACFGVGSIVGMAILTSVLGAPMLRLRRAPVWTNRLLKAVGATSIALGIWWGGTSAQVLLGG